MSASTASPDPLVNLIPPQMAYAFTGPNTAHHDIYPSISPLETPSLHQPGKVILITGAGRGCGRAMALQYAHANVSAIVLVSRTLSQLDAVEAEIKDINSSIRVRKYSVDVKNEGGVAKCAADIEKEEGRLDVLVNNAGVAGPWKKIDETEPANWWNTLEVNLEGPYLFLQKFLPLMVSTAATHKRTVDVVNVTSIGALGVGAEGMSAYATSKAALCRLSEFVAAEYGAKGVNCVSLHPGGIKTELAKVAEDVLAPFLIDTAELSGGVAVWLTAGQRTWLAGRYVSAHWDVDILESKKDEIVEGDKLKLKLAL